MVPGSTFRYGSHFCKVTLKPRLSRRQPIEEAATPFPREETTPPVTKIYFGAIRAARNSCRAYQPSTGLTYIQLCSECAPLSNRTILSPILSPITKSAAVCQGRLSRRTVTHRAATAPVVLAGMKRRVYPDLSRQGNLL